MKDRVGQQFGNYQLLRLLGRGGFAEVYLGQHIYLKKQVAIKIVSTPLLQIDQQSYLQEARMQFALNHPNILHISDCGIEQDLPFLVMDYAPYGTLRQHHVRGARVPLQQVLTYLSSIAPALQYAHDHKLIHCDLKPENMLIGQNKEILLSDFGIAIIASTSKPQIPYNVAGTATYMAPEQITGQPVYASDQYALGVIIYEWLAGRPPFQGSFRELTAKHLHLLPPTLSSQGATLPPVVEAAVMRTLEKEPAQRFASVQEFALALTSNSQMMSQHIIDPSARDGGRPSQSILISPPIPSAQMTDYPNMTNAPAMTPVLPSATSTSLHAHISPPYHPPITTIALRKRPTRTIIITLLLLIIVIAGAGILGPRFFPVSPSTGQRPDGSSSGKGNVATPTPAHAQLASALPTGWREKDDPLSDNSLGYDWEEVTGTYKDCQFLNGGYQVAENGYYVFCLAHNTNYSDFALEVQMQTAMAAGGGIVFREGASGEYYFTVVNQDNTTVDLFVRDCSSTGSCKTLKSETSNQLDGLFRKGPNELNSLAVVAKGSSFTFFVNEQQVATLTDSTYSQGQVGLGVGTAATLNIASAEMSKVKIWVP